MTCDETEFLCHNKKGPFLIKSGGGTGGGRILREKLMAVVAFPYSLQEEMLFGKVEEEEE